MSFFHTTEFYVILFLVAAAILAFIAKPHNSGAVIEHLLGSALSLEGTADSNQSEKTGENRSASAQSISIDCDDSGTVWLRRSGIEGLDASGALSAKIVVKGFNITVYERICRGRYDDSPVDTALFNLDFLASDRYWLRYESEDTNRSATLSFRNTPGYHAQAVLKQ